MITIVIYFLELSNPLNDLYLEPRPRVDEVGRLVIHVVASRSWIRAATPGLDAWRSSHSPPRSGRPHSQTERNRTYISSLFLRFLLFLLLLLLLLLLLYHITPIKKEMLMLLSLVLCCDRFRCQNIASAPLPVPFSLISFPRHRDQAAGSVSLAT